MAKAFQIPAVYFSPCTHIFIAFLYSCTCYAHEAVGEDGELHSVELSAEDTVRVRAYSHANIAPFCQMGLTAWLHQDGADPRKSRKNSSYGTFISKWGKYITAMLTTLKSPSSQK